MGWCSQNQEDNHHCKSEEFSWVVANVRLERAALAVFEPSNLLLECYNAREYRFFAKYCEVFSRVIRKKIEVFQQSNEGEVQDENVAPTAVKTVQTKIPAPPPTSDDFLEWVDEFWAWFRDHFEQVEPAEKNDAVSKSDSVRE